MGHDESLRGGGVNGGAQPWRHHGSDFICRSRIKGAGDSRPSYFRDILIADHGKSFYRKGARSKNDNDSDMMKTVDHAEWASLSTINSNKDKDTQFLQNLILTGGSK
jgi:hypothetical protein